MFLLTDTQIKEESFLEDVDGLLNAGEVPNLFPLDEKQEIVEVKSSTVCTRLAFSVDYVRNKCGCNFVHIAKW